MNTLPLEYHFFLVAAVYLAIGIMIGAAGVSKLSAVWKHAAKYWRHEAIRQKEFNWNWAEESFWSNKENKELVGQNAAWQDHYNQSLRAETELREQLLENGIEPDA